MSQAAHVRNLISRDDTNTAVGIDGVKPAVPWLFLRLVSPNGSCCYHLVDLSNVSCRKRGADIGSILQCYWAEVVYLAAWAL
jgi:hypothetical protein